MSFLTLVTGGARSGKSSFAESQLAKHEQVCYIATGISASDDLEMQERIKCHQTQRPSQWRTHEGFLDLPEYIKDQEGFQSYLFDCATLFTTNYFFHLLEVEFGLAPADFDQGIEKMSMADFRYIEQLIMVEWQLIIQTFHDSLGADVYLVTNEIGLGLVPQTKLGRLFRDLLGRVNQFLAKEADAVYFVISGLPQQIK